MSFSSLKTSSKALQTINLLQKIQFREISINEIEEAISSFEHYSLLINILQKIFTHQIPIPKNNKENLLSQFKVSTDVDNCDTRLVSILEILNSCNKSKREIYFSCLNLLTSNLLHFQEAKFYADLFTGIKFGIPLKIAQKFIKLDINSNSTNNSSIEWMKPKFAVKDNFEIDLPVYGEILYDGLLFKAIYDNRNKTTSIFSEKQKDCTNNFPRLVKILSRILPKNKEKVFIDFIVVPQMTFLDKGLISLAIASGKSIEEKDIVFLDMYWSQCNESLSFRKELVKKLVLKIKKKGLDCSYAPSRYMTEKEEVINFINKCTNKYNGCIIKEETSIYKNKKSNKWLKFIKPFASQVVKLLDYKYSFEPCLSLDFIVASTEDKKQVIISEYNIHKPFIINNIPKYIDRYARISWKQHSDGYLPVLVEIY